jgi:nucleotide-binding universal stress UspA family protein
MSDTAAPPLAGAGAQNAPSPTRARIFLCVVDATEELQGALRFACRRAQHTGGRVALLYVMEPAEVGHWMAIEEKLREERREEAERTLNAFATQVNEMTGTTPVLYLREGKPADEIVKLVQEEPAISILVLGAGTGKKGPGPLVSSIAGKLSGKFPRPITIVPGNLTLEQIDDMT